MAEQVHEGGCLCGKVRYRLTGPLGGVTHCHCRTCQKSSGAGFMSWTAVKFDNFSWRSDEPAYFASGEKTFRGFCGDCGSPLSFHYQEPKGWAYVTVGSLDGAPELRSAIHLWTRRRLGWIDVEPELAGYEEDMV